MNTYIKISMMIYGVIIILYGCGSGLNTVSIDSDKSIKFKNYSIHSPIGDDWEYQPNEVTQSVMFYRQSDDAMQYVTGNSRSTYINVYRDSTVMPTKNIDRNEFANGFMDNEFQIMEANLGNTIYGEPQLIDRDTLLINNKTFYRMNYKSSGYPSQGYLYVYLPNHFEEASVFYLFIIEEYGGDDILSSGYDFDQIKNVLVTFKCDED